MGEGSLVYCERTCSCTPVTKEASMPDFLYGVEYESHTKSTVKSVLFIGLVVNIYGSLRRAQVSILTS